jgi:hypothetical protein
MQKGDAHFSQTSKVTNIERHFYSSPKKSDGVFRDGINMQKCYIVTRYEHKSVSNSAENIRESFCDVKVKKDKEGACGLGYFHCIDTPILFLYTFRHEESSFR